MCGLSQMCVLSGKWTEREKPSPRGLSLTAGVLPDSMGSTGMCLRVHPDTWQGNWAFTLFPAPGRCGVPLVKSPLGP